MRQSALSATSINRILEVLSSVIEEALEQGMISGRNPAAGKRRRLPVGRPRRTFLDRAEQIASLLDAAGRMDGEGHRQSVANRRALLATLVLAGLRIGEALELRWRDVHLASGSLHVRDAKTDAGVRTVDLLPLLRDELAELSAARRDADPTAYVFATSTGGRQQATNLRRHVLAPAIMIANEQLLARGAEPLPAGLTPHSLRRTFASLLYALGESPPYVMAQMGHTSPNLALAIYYAKAMDRRDGEPERLQALVGGSYREIAGNGTPVGDERDDVRWSVST